MEIHQTGRALSEALTVGSPTSYTEGGDCRVMDGENGERYRKSRQRSEWGTVSEICAVVGILRFDYREKRQKEDIN